MIIKGIQNKNEWENFLEECDEKSFLQSWDWGEFQKTMGQKIWRLGAYENEKLVGLSLAILVKAKRGTYLLVEHGPAVKCQLSNIKCQIVKELLDFLKTPAKKEKASFIRICPIWKRESENIKIFRDLGFRNAPIHEHPETSWILPLSKSEDELLMGMRKTTRYLIRQAIKNPDIEITKSRNPEDVKIFNAIYQKTVEREHFVPFSLKYLENEFQAFSRDNQILIFLGKYKNEVVASAMIIYWQDSGFYHQGASLRKYAKIPVNYLLQWEAIKEAKNRGMRYYSFWGIADIDQKDNSKFKIQNSKFKSHPWAGLTLFKTGFGGHREEYVKAKDLVLSPMYWLDYVIEYSRKIKRGFR